jgi:hypothetical protein
MSDELHRLIERAKAVIMNPKEKEEQRRSFAYGNTNIENEKITRETVDEEAEKLRASHG